MCHIWVGVRGNVNAPGAFTHIERYTREEEHLEGTALTVLYGIHALYVTVLHGFDCLTCAICRWACAVIYLPRGLSPTLSRTPDDKNT